VNGRARARARGGRGRERGRNGRTRPSVVGTERRSPSLPTGCLCNCQIITIGGNFSRVDIDCGILLIIGTGRFRARPDDDGTVVAAFQPPALFQPTLLRPVSFRLSVFGILPLVNIREALIGGTGAMHPLGKTVSPPSPSPSPLPPRVHVPMSR